MKLRTFNRYEYQESDISCGIVTVALITGERPSKIKNRLNDLRRKKGWSERKIRANQEWTYWYEARKLISRAAIPKRTVYPKNNLPLYLMRDKFQPGRVYMVATDEHLQIVKDGKIYDAFASLHGKEIDCHCQSFQKVWYYCQLVARKKS